MMQAVVEAYEWCASINLQGFFDEIPHDRPPSASGLSQSRSMIVTLAWPPPSHIVWKP